MATRLYLPSTGAASISPPFGGWDSTVGADRLKLVATKVASALADKTVTSVASPNPHSQLCRQYISAPLSGDQTITGTVKGQILARESSSTGNFHMQTLIRVVSGDGTVERGTLLALSSTANVDTVPPEFNNSASTNHNQKIPYSQDTGTLSSVSALSGDRIVVGLGAHGTNALTSVTFTLVFGDSHGATDLPEDETTSSSTGTATWDPWIEFSQTLTLAAETAGGNKLSMMA